MNSLTRNLFLASVAFLAPAVYGQTSTVDSGATASSSSGATATTQTTTTTAPVDQAAASDWSALSFALIGATSAIEAKSGPLVEGQSVAPLDQQILNLQQTSKLAQSFYLAHGTDAHAPTAKRAEVMSALQSVQLGGTQYQAAALALATKLVNDTTVSVQDRFDTSVMVATVTRSTALNGRDPFTNALVYAMIGDELHAKYGDVDQVYQFYLQTARTADFHTSLQLANKILAMNAPAWAKAQATALAAQGNLVGKPLALKLQASDGTTLDLSQPPGKVTVVYVWGGAAWPNDLVALNSVKALVPVDLNWVYVALNAPSPSLASASAQVPFAGTQCFDPENFTGAVGRALHLSDTPLALVITAKGVLSGFGPPSQLAALIATARQQ